MERVNGCCFRDIYKGGLWENDLHVSAQLHIRVKRVRQMSFKRALLIGQRTTHATAANHSQDFSE